MKLKNIHLLLSVSIVFPIAIVYGFFPDAIDVKMSSVNESSIFKAIMGLYLGFGSLWILGVFKENYWKTATISNMIFMFGLGFGRIISLIFDGVPSTVFVLGTVGELVLGLFALYNLKKHIQ